MGTVELINGIAEHVNRKKKTRTAAVLHVNGRKRKWKSIEGGRKR